jgi:hypothetical protein
MNSQVKYGFNPKIIFHNIYNEEAPLNTNKTAISKDYQRVRLRVNEPTQELHSKFNIEPLRFKGIKQSLFFDSEIMDFCKYLF